MEGHLVKEKLNKEKEQLLSVVAFSANKKTVESLEEFFKKKGIECFFFYENFLSYPISYNTTNKELEKITSSFPFLRRYIELPEIKFIPDIKAIRNLNKSIKFQELIENPPLIPRTKESLEKLIDENLQRIDLSEKTIYGSGLFALWKEVIENIKGKQWNEQKKNEILQCHERDFLYSKPFIWEKKENIVGYIGKFPKAYLKGEYLQEILKSEKNRLPLLVEYFVSDFQFVLSGVNGVNHLFMSISSKDLFYGYVWLFWSGSKINEKDLEDEVGNIIKKRYSPIMAIFENAWEEKILKKHFKQGGEIEWKKRNLIELKGEKSYPLNLAFLKKENFEDELEESLHQLWERKWDLWQRTKSLKELEKTLIFYKFFISSEKMIEKLKNITKLNPSKKGDFLPSALVIGGPGAGKDSISKLIKVFSEEYFDAPIYTINVASLKPASLAPSFSVGTEVSLNNNILGKEGKINLIGIFEKILKEVKQKNIKLQKEKNRINYSIEKNESEYKVYKNNNELFRIKRKSENKLNLEDIKSTFEKKLKSQSLTEDEKEIIRSLFKEIIITKAVVVLDELNSLDVDTQGALLRLLENSELVPIGAIKSVEDKEAINFLIIGTMNEDPEKLTKESIIRDLTREKMFGGIVGEILYEHFRNIRRLREDLYYRFIRGGKIVLPSLNERREDIPVLFYVFCDAGVESKDIELHILLDILEEITAPYLDWIGNVRQLQSLSQVVIRYALQDKKNKRVIVRKEHLYQGLKDIGMIENERF